MRIHNKPASQWRGAEELDYIDDEAPRYGSQKTKRKKNDYHSIMVQLQRRLANGLKDFHYRFSLMRRRDGTINWNWED